jgi:predicted MFS family arabinose efflux permease
VATSAYVADVVDPKSLGASMGALSSVMDVGHSAGPLVAGLVIGHYGFPGGFIGSAALVSMTALYFAASIRQRRVRPEARS